MKRQDLRRPLSDEEREELGEFLAGSPGAMSVAEAQGFFTALGSAPTTIMPSVWQPRVLGEAEPRSRQEAERVMELLMRLYNQALSGLEEGRPLDAELLEDEDALALWCSGYIEATRLDDQWSSDDEGIMRLFPFAVLADQVDLGWRRGRGRQHHRGCGASSKPVPRQAAVVCRPASRVLGRVAPGEHEPDRPPPSQGRAQRALSLRQRAQVQEVLRLSADAGRPSSATSAREIFLGDTRHSPRLSDGP
jgi:yecA family protein